MPKEVPTIGCLASGKRKPWPQLNNATTQPRVGMHFWQARLSERPPLRKRPLMTIATLSRSGPLSRFVSYFSSETRLIRPWVYLVLPILTLASVVARRVWPPFPFARFLLSNRNFSSLPEDIHAEATVEIEGLVACAGKDIGMLIPCLDGLLSSSQNPVVKITVVVPDDVQEEAEAAIATSHGNLGEVEVLIDSDIIGKSALTRIRDAFGQRAGWAIQQIVRNRYIEDYAKYPVLVVDADTILCRERTWVFPNSSQVMTPTWEYNKKYYQFLKRYFRTPLRPLYTFVPHHMLIQPKLFRQANKAAGLTHLSTLIDAVSHQSQDRDQSSFCVIYEFYAQWLWKHHRSLVRLQRWGNISISRADVGSTANLEYIAHMKRLGYASVSIHSWS